MQARDSAASAALTITRMARSGCSAGTRCLQIDVAEQRARPLVRPAHHTLTACLRRRSESRPARKREGFSTTCFSGLNLLHVKRQVAQLLQQIGGQGIFDEYTRHDISHIDVMLGMLTDCIIPERTQDIMSKADPA